MKLASRIQHHGVKAISVEEGSGAYKTVIKVATAEGLQWYRSPLPLEGIYAEGCEGRGGVFKLEEPVEVILTLEYDLEARVLRARIACIRKQQL